MNRLITLRTITPMHLGTGQSVGTTDLPIAREKTTGWPVVPGTSAKGVLKDFIRVEYLSAKANAVRNKEAGADADKALAYLFGSPANEDAAAGALAITDMRCLLFPVRSLVGTFAYVTCPLALERTNELIAVAKGDPIPVLKPAGPTNVWVTKTTELIHGKEAAAKVFLEDLDLKAERAETNGPSARLAALFGIEADTLARHLAIVPNDLFTFLSSSATEITTHVSLVFETRTARDGFLRTEERVPEEACFVGLVMIDQLHREGRQEEVERQVLSLDGQFLQFGGKASVGNGLCRVGLAQ